LVGRTDSEGRSGSRIPVFGVRRRGSRMVMGLSDALTVAGVVTAAVAAIVMAALIGWNERSASLSARRRRAPR